MLKLCISVFLIFTLLKNFKWDLIHSVLAHANWYSIFALIPLSILGQIVCAVKWWYITKAFLSKTSMATYVEFYFIGSFINRFLPSTIGGDIGRAGLLSWKEDIPFSQSSVTVLIDRVTGFIVLLFTACIGIIIFFSKSVPSTVILLGVCSIIGISSILLFSLTSILSIADKFPFLKRFNDIFRLLIQYRKNYKIIFVSLSVSLLFYLIELITHWALFLQFNISIPFINLLTILPIIYLVGNIPIAISGIGIRENSYIYFFGFISIPSEISLSVAIIIFLYIIIQGLIGGLLLLRILLFSKMNMGKHQFPSISIISCYHNLMFLKTRCITNKPKEQLE